VQGSTVSVGAIHEPDQSSDAQPSVPEEDTEGMKVEAQSDAWSLQGEDRESDLEEEPLLSLWSDVPLLVVAIALTTVTLEWLVSSIDSLTAPGHISKEWIGLILLPLLSGNTAERINSVASPVKDKLTICVNAAVGSTIQIAVFIIPLVICIAWIMHKPLTLLFDPFEPSFSPF